MKRRRELCVVNGECEVALKERCRNNYVTEWSDLKEDVVTQVERADAEAGAGVRDLVPAVGPAGLGDAMVDFANDAL
ncbi:hypothetical protein EVAR_23289_1 [Eumeta japonica]|uniref:Uncharacterized protein n=1 Tax=Eumeta variegata TaxID=151549 RepID=A0A4C1V6N3_EUMVA|nr:hypothetical protein EVAR_23289_1 [Eumeta japonica]